MKCDRCIHYNVCLGYRNIDIDGDSNSCLYAEERLQGDAISRQAAKDRIKAICEKYHLSYEDGERKTSTGGSAYALGHAFDGLSSLELEIPKGEWIVDGHHYKCSRCGKTLAIMFSETDDDDLIGCPFCLADMRVKDELGGKR